jgi:two-component system chemotaxis response regulator CheY
VKANADGLPRRGVLKPTILVVDDEDTIRDFLRSALEGEGYAVLAAGDGEDALSLCDRYRVDVILLDLMMPRLDGLGFLHRFRRRFGPEGVSVYIMSAVRTAVEHAAAVGVAGAFVKPFDLEELLETIAADVRRRPLPARGDGSPQTVRYAEPA